MNDKPTQDLATRAFQMRVLDEFAAVRAMQVQMQAEQAEMRKELTELRSEQSAMAQNIAALDQRLTSVEERLASLEDNADSRLKETRPVWAAVQEQLRKLDRKFDLAIKDLFELRSEVATHDKLVDDLQKRILTSS